MGPGKLPGAFRLAALIHLVGLGPRRASPLLKETDTWRHVSAMKGIAEAAAPLFDADCRLLAGLTTDVVSVADVPLVGVAPCE